MLKLVFVRYTNPKDLEYNNRIGLIVDNSTLSGECDFLTDTPGNHKSILFFGETSGIDYAIQRKYLSLTNQFSTSREWSEIKKAVMNAHLLPKMSEFMQTLRFIEIRKELSESQIKEKLEETGLLLSVFLYEKKGGCIDFKIRDGFVLADVMELISEIEVELDIRYLKNSPVNI